MEQFHARKKADFRQPSPTVNRTLLKDDLSWLRERLSITPILLRLAQLQEIALEFLRDLVCCSFYIFTRDIDPVNKKRIVDHLYREGSGGQGNRIGEDQSIGRMFQPCLYLDDSRVDRQLRRDHPPGNVQVRLDQFAGE